MTAIALLTFEDFLKTLLFLKIPCKVIESSDSLISKFIILLTRKLILCIQNHSWILFRYNLSIPKASCNSIFDCCNPCILSVFSSFFCLLKRFCWYILKFECAIFFFYPFFYSMENICRCLLQKRNNCHLIFVFQLKGTLTLFWLEPEPLGQNIPGLVSVSLSTFGTNLWVWHVFLLNRTFPQEDWPSACTWM